MVRKMSLVLDKYNGMIASDLNYTHAISQPSHIRLDLSNAASDFWYDYCRTIHQDNDDSSLSLSYTESGAETSPINVTLVLRGEDANIPAIRAQSFIVRLVSIVQSVIYEVYETSNTKDAYGCLVLIGENPYKDEMGSLCQVISLRFPLASASVLSQTKEFRVKLIEHLQQHHDQLSKGLEVKLPLDTWERALLKSPPMGEWTLYGSIAGLIRTKVRLEHRLTYIPLDEVELETDANLSLHPYSYGVEVVDIFNPSLHSAYQHSSSGSLPLERFSEFSFWLPVILSNRFSSQVLKLRPTGSKSSTPLSTTDNSGMDNLDTDVNIAKALLPMIGRRTESEWIVIGKCLFNAWDNPIFVYRQDTSSRHHMKKMALELWKSHLSTRGYDTDALSESWETFDHCNEFSLRTIAYMARQDDETGYNKWNDVWLAGPIRRAVETSKKRDHMTIGEAFYRRFWLDYAYVEGPTKPQCKWYRYRNHHWNIVYQSDITSSIGIFRADISVKMSKISQDLLNVKDENQKDILNNLLGLATTLYEKFGEMAWIKNIIEASQSRFVIPIFSKLADDNKTLTGVRNGVIEVNEKYARFRPGRPEDFITKFSDVQYNTSLHPNHPDVKAYLKYIRQVFPDEQLSDLMLRFFSSLLHGNPSKFFFVWTGCGDNGKSTIVRLLNATLGDEYVVNISPTFITMKRGNSSNASPDLVALRHSRLVVIQEPDEGESIKTGKLKEATGGDKIRARALYDNGAPVDPTYQIVLQCNEIPDTKKEQAMTNRVVIVPFLSIWKDGATPEDASRNVFEKNRNFMFQVYKHAASCLYMMVHYYEQLKLRPITDSDIPKVVRDHTTNYWNKVDVFYRFVSDRIDYVYTDRQVNEPYYDPTNPSKRNPNRQLELNATLSHFDLYQEFVSWYRLTGRIGANKGEIPIYDKFISEFTKSFGEPEYFGWQGITFREQRGVGMQ